MIPVLQSIRHTRDFRLELSFNDGLRAEVDFATLIHNRQGIWQPLHDVSFFKQARADAELQTIVWPNGVDICPDVLYSMASGKPIGSLSGEVAHR